MSGLGKRTANVPAAALVLDPQLSKADLWEIAWSLASLCNDGEGCDDESATLRRLVEEANAQRARRGMRAVKLVARAPTVAPTARRCPRCGAGPGMHKGSCDRSGAEW